METIKLILINITLYKLFSKKKIKNNLNLYSKIKHRTRKNNLKKINYDEFIDKEKIYNLCKSF